MRERIWGQGFYLSLGPLVPQLIKWCGVWWTRPVCCKSRRSMSALSWCACVDLTLIEPLTCLACSSGKMIMALCNRCCWVTCAVSCIRSACQRSYSQCIQSDALLTSSGQSWCKCLMQMDGFGCNEKTCGRCKWYNSARLMPTHLMLMKAP
jgi:hypothetical protein